jgi:hypothetical protein
MARALIVAAEISEDIQKEKEKSITEPDSQSSPAMSPSTHAVCGEPEISDADIPF